MPVWDLDSSVKNGVYFIEAIGVDYIDSTSFTLMGKVAVLR